MRFLYLLLSLIPFVASESASCSKKSDPVNCMKGRLEIKGICSNYVITITDGPVDTSKVEAAWTDPETNKTYKNAFKLGSPCTFPSNLKEGDEFYFNFVDETKEDCAVCMAYRPVPDKINMINVMNTPCNSLSR